MGKWVVLTGIDGAGKCEVGKFLTKTLKKKP
jgi:thymidylate kinase